MDEQHSLCTLAAVGALTLVARPFLVRSEAFKIAVVGSTAAAYAAAAASQSGRACAWTYPAAVAGRCAFAALWTLLCVRWHLPCSRFNADKRSYLWIRWMPIALLAAASAIAPATAAGRLVCRTCPALAFLWYGAGNYCARTLVPSSLAVAVPTAFACWTGRPSPVEALAVFATNALVVLATLAFDKSRGMVDAYSPDFPSRFGLDRRYLGQLARAFVTPEYAVPAAVVDDIKTCDGIVNAVSRSFFVNRYFWQASVRLDLTIVYAYIRCIDDFIDNEPDSAKNKPKYDMLKRFVDEMFADRNSDADFLPRPRVANIDWAQYRSHLTDVQMAIFRAMSRIVFYMPRKPFDAMLNGFSWDIEDRVINSEDDLWWYTDNVTGSIVEILSYSIMYRCDHESYDIVGRRHFVENTHMIGRVLQYINMARDIVVDSETLGRCYLPRDYLDDKEKDIRILCIDKKPRDMGNEKLMKYSMKCIELSNRYQLDIDNFIMCLPHDIRGSYRSMVETYLAIKSVILSSPIYPRRAVLSKWKIVRIGIYNTYFKTIKYVKSS